MSKEYKIKVSGLFDSKQLETALRAAAKGANLTVDLKVNTQATQQATAAIKKVRDELSNGPQIDFVSPQAINRLTQITDGTRHLRKEITEYSLGVNQVLQQTQIWDTEEEKLVDTQFKLVTNEKQLQHLRDTHNARNVNLVDTLIKKREEEGYKFSRNLREQMQLEATRGQVAEQAANRSSAALTRELEILQRRLGTLKEGITLQGGYTEQDVLQAAGLPSSATITRNGALTPTALSGTWDRYTVSVRNAAGAFDTYQIAVNQATGAVRVLSQGAYATNKALAAQGETLDRLIVKVAKWAALTTLVYMPIRAFKEALQTLKEVDSELVTIQKVTDLSESQIRSLTSAVYGLASAYGRTADELLAMTSTFARAGFQEQLEDMTELAALTQNVGDLTGEEASKFIIAANAAWKLNGNMSSLMSIIDGMNEVTNHSANDFQALSQGISVAGSVFANAGESAQTFTAMLGTVVASTQRSGSEVARGLRTIAMNIRQIKGELDDGEIIDESTISDAAAALSSVGISVSENGQLRKVSDVLTDLATKWNDLTTAEQSYVASSLAGKRQANVLIALMQNYDEYYKEMENYANGAGSALRENEIYLDSWEAKTKMLKATWTEFVSSLVDTKLIKGGLDLAIMAVDTLNNSFVQTALVVGVAIKAVNVLGTRLLGLEGGISFLRALGLTVKYWTADLATSFGMLADKNVANAVEMGSIAIPLMAASAVVAGLIALIKKYNEEVSKQKDIVADLNTEYERRFGKNSEYAELLSREKELTDVEQNRLLFLKAEAQSLQNDIDKEQAKYEKLFFSHFHKRDDKYGYKKNEAGYYTEAFTQAEYETQQMQTAYRSLISAYNEGRASLSDTTSGLADFIAKGEETYNVLNNTTGAIDEQDSAWLQWYVAILGAYERLTQLNNASQESDAIIDEIGAKIERLSNKYTDLKTKTEPVTQAQTELNEQGFISVDTFDRLAEAYPDIIKSSTALANGYKVEDGALGDLISAQETESNVLLYQARSVAIQFINARVGMAAATNESTKAILDHIEALEVEARIAAEVNAKSMEDYERYLANDKLYQQARSLKEMLKSAEQISALINSGSSKTSTSSTSSQNTVLNGINDYYDIIKHRIWLSEQRMGDDVSTEKYKRELEQQAEYYVGLKKWAHEEAEKLRKQGYADESDEIKKLQQIWWESENWLRDQAKKTAEERKKAIDDVLSKLKDNLDLQKDDLDAQIKKLEALIDLHDAYYDTLTEVEKEQANINKELKTAKESYQYLDETTRKMLFNESDYAVLSAKLTDIANDAAAIYDNYQASINALTEDNIYLAEQLTHEFEQQYEAKRKEYEIAKAELAMTKAQTSLQNAKANRNTFMLVNGQFQWVADPKAIKDALEEYADAEQEYNEAIKDASRERIKDELENSKQNIATEKARLEAQYEAIERAWKIITDSMQASTQDISTILRQISQSAAPSLKSAISQFAHWLSALVDIDLTGFDSAMNEGVVLVDNDSGSIDVPIDNSSSSTSDPASERYYVVRNGKMVIVDGFGNVIDNGSTSTSNSSTSSGSSREEEIRALARKYDVDLGVATSMWEANQRGANYDRGGIALGKGILLKDTALAEGVLDPDIMRSVLNPTKNKMFENFVAGVSMLLDEKNLKRLNNGVISGDDHSITVNGMTVTGQAAENLAKAMRAVMPLHA